MIIFLLNLGFNVSGYLSIQNEMACFPNSWGILLYRFVTLNVAMSEFGSIFFLVYIYIFFFSGVLSIVFYLI